MLEIEIFRLGLDMSVERRRGNGGTNPDAAWRPRPREPPVTTTTFPLREKMEGKSLSCVSAIVD